MFAVLLVIMGIILGIMIGTGVTLIYVEQQIQDEWKLTIGEETYYFREKEIK